ncbi:hypothetical protein JNUCC1_02825 [Lentibacillus sp. JNUCC-1]|nr:hypothetical protein [Lentibacillus sp. JNUCC-1]
MTFIALTGVLLLGIILLAAGFFTKKSWLKLVSLIPLAISHWQIVILFSL